MIWLVLGLAIWIVGHTFKRFAPDLRGRMGEPGKGVIAVVLLAGIVLMVVGYRAAEPTPLWQMGSWAISLNNVLVLIAVALLGVGNSKSRMRGWLRHPMLAGVLVWAGAHLLVNGDVPSLVLFGGLAVWALLEVLVINRAEPAPAPFTAGNLGGDIRLAIITLVVFAVMAGLHVWLGPSPFPG